MKVTILITKGNNTDYKRIDKYVVNNNKQLNANKFTHSYITQFT